MKEKSDTQLSQLDCLFMLLGLDGYPMSPTQTKLLGHRKTFWVNQLTLRFLKFESQEKVVTGES
jgi:hypothetical protein